jgi:hypothetical protein
MSKKWCGGGGEAQDVKIIGWRIIPLKFYAELLFYLI